MTQSKQVSLVKKTVSDLQAYAPTIERSLPSYMRSKAKMDKFMRVAEMAIQVPGIAEKLDQNKLDRSTLFTSCQKAAQDGLLLDGREATLTVFYSKKENVSKVQYIPMVAGIMKKMRNSGMVTKLEAQVVHKNDNFSFNPATDEVPSFNPDWFGNRGEPLGVFAVARLKESNVAVVEIMSKEQIMAIANETHNADQYIPEKGKHWGEWWRKTVIRRICKYLPSSTDLDQLFEHDNEQFVYNDSPAPQHEENVMDLATGADTGAKEGLEDKLAANARSKSKDEPIDAEFTPVEDSQDDDVI